MNKLISDNNLSNSNNIIIFKKRNYGVDLLKIFSMVNIINLHINGKSSYLRILPNDVKYKQIYLLECFSFFPVDLFGLISGFISYKRYKFSNLIYLWFENCFYSIIFAIFFFVKYKNIKFFILSFLPLGTKRYWYFNAYFFMYLLLPFISTAINTIDKNLFTKMICCYFFMYSFYYVFLDFIDNSHDFAFINNGYSSIWLIILYIFGGYLGRFYYHSIKISKFILFFSYLLSSLITSQFIFYNINNHKIPNKIFLNYYSPTIIIQSLSLLFLFNNIKIKNRILIKIILFLNPLNFNVALLHLKFFNSGTYTVRRFYVFIKSLSPNFLFFKIYIISFIIYFICAILDYFRFLIFKILRIRYICQYIENKFI